MQSFLLLDSGAQLHARPIKCLGKKAPLLDPGIHTASGARLKHDGGRLVTFKLPEGRTIRVLFMRVRFKNPSCLLVISLSRGIGVIFAQTLFFLDKIQTKHSQTQLHKEESLFFVKGMLVDCPQMLDDVEDPMPARPATLKVPGTPSRIVMEKHSLTHFPSQPWCKMCVESPCFTASRTVENRRSCASTSC